MSRELFPMFFEYSALQRRARSERTLFVTIEEDGTLHWVDHTGRLAPSRGLSDFDSGPILSFIRGIGKPWLGGWNSEQSTEFHALLDDVYWEHVNPYVYKPFDKADR